MKPYIYLLQTVVNYIAAYQWSDSDSKWHIVKDSSFNTDGRFGPFDLIKPDGGLGDDGMDATSARRYEEKEFILNV